MIAAAILLLLCEAQSLENRAMRDLEHLLANNRAWSSEITSRDPEFFRTLARQQSPAYLWIGCSDSRVPANQIVGLLPGELFVHRNVANVVVHTDLNCLSVMQFAVDVLKVQHILVVGHYGCSGVEAALNQRRIGLVDNWLRHVQDVRLRHAAMLERVRERERADRLCELNVIEQVVNVCHSPVVHGAWERGQQLAIHGWTYALKDGLVHDLKMNVSAEADIASTYEHALARLG
jgi:carbonic anhydrase